MNEATSPEVELTVASAFDSAMGALHEARVQMQVVAFLSELLPQQRKPPTRQICIDGRWVDARRSIVEPLRREAVFRLTAANERYNKILGRRVR